MNEWGNLYRHYKGGLYEFIILARNESDGNMCAVYMDTDGVTWVRPFEEWKEKFTRVEND